MVGTARCQRSPRRATPPARHLQRPGGRRPGRRRLRRRQPPVAGGVRLDRRPVTGQINSWCDRADQRTVKIAAHWGFERRNESIETPEDLDPDQPWAWNYELRLDSGCHADTEDVPALPPNVAVSRLGEVLDDADLAASLHEGYEECRSDVPAWEPYKPGRRSDFVKAQHERLQQGGVGLVAHRNGDVVAATFAEGAAFVRMIQISPWSAAPPAANAWPSASRAGSSETRPPAAWSASRRKSAPTTDPCSPSMGRSDSARIALRQLTRTPAIAIGRDG